MSQKQHFVLILCLATFSSGVDSGLDVSQSPSSLMVTQGSQAKLHCSFTAGEASLKGAVSWHRVDLGENTSSSQAIPLRGRFSLNYPRTFLSEGDGSLLISNVTWDDAGIYFCKVFMWEQGEEQGNGTQLIVNAPPSQPEIFLLMTMQTDVGITLLCRTRRFYPRLVHLSWQSLETPLPSPGPLEMWESEYGAYEATSLLVLPTSSVPITLTCIIQHVSLTEPLSTNYTYSPPEQRLTGNQLVGCLNIIKMSILVALTLRMILTVMKKCNNRE